MQKRTIWGVCLLTLCLALAAVGPARAQSPAKAKPTVYTYVATWDVPRAQWGDMAKLDEQDKPLLDKLVADGTLVGYGAYYNLIHQEGEPTHGSWFTATSEGNLLKALEAIYAQPASIGAAVQGASKHWDQILTGDIYNAKAGSSAGYLTWSKWEVKPGQLHAYIELNKSAFVPILEKLLAEGTITSYGELTEDYHTGKLGTVYDYITVPDAASLDKANKAFDDAFANPAIGDAIRALTEHDGHRDYLTRLRYMTSK
jgi:DNA-binding Lrp family transcriptional regulator